MNHMVIYNKKVAGHDVIAQILSGSKRLGFKFTTNRTAPYQKLADGDTVYLKESSGPIVGRITVKSVKNIELTNPEMVMEFLTKHFEALGLNEEHLMGIWRFNQSKRYLCYWRVDTTERAHHPVMVHKADRRVWVAGYEPSEEVLAAFTS
ncbi:MAG TPA: hypothetical protein VJ841_03150 [Candidatus Saccharimonadales bacterium]|nr:hypothetical protein [Candidatus Saccharimonadales bacterium]